MPRKNIWYCVDNCGPGKKYRELCPNHHGIDLNHVGLAEFDDGRQKIFHNGECPASGGVRMQITLKKEPKYE